MPEVIDERDVDLTQEQVEGTQEPTAGAETPAGPEGDAPAEQPQMALPPGVKAIDLTQKDVDKLAQLEDLDRKFQAACGAIVRGLAEALVQVQRIEGFKTQLASGLKEKYELAEDTQWQADFRSGKLYYRTPEPKSEPPKEG